LLFNLLIGLSDGVVPAGRLLEYTDDSVRQRFTADLAALQDLPVLSMPETGDSDQEQVARVGRVVALKAAGRTHTFTFVPDPAFGQVGSATVEALATKLGITGWEFQRTHWAVKDVDLFAVLLEHQLQQTRVAPGNFTASGAVQFPVHIARDPSLVAVMMPFDKSFDIVYETIAQASEDAGLASVRADDIWEHDHVMGDVLSLIWRAAIVVSDLTGKNTNVFYETGLAHALPRRTVLLTQSAGDVPFDLQALRYLHYGLGTADRATLRKQLAERLTTLSSQPLV
jgi:hypothetical protein